MNKRRKAYLRQLVADKKKVPGLSEDDIRYIVSHINSQMRKQVLIDEPVPMKVEWKHE